MNILGPLSSTSGSCVFYVDLSSQLDTSESLSTVNITSSDDLSISQQGIVPNDITTKAGNVLLTNKSVYFRVSCSGGQNTIAQLTINYTTDASNQNLTLVKLKLAPTII